MDEIPKIRRLSRRPPPTGVNASPVAVGEIPYLHAFVMDALGPGIASVDTVRRVHSRQSFSLWKVSDKVGRWTGAYAFLYLNQDGLTAVQENRFDSATPDIAHLADKPSEVRGIFAWCLVLRGKSKAALLQAASWIELCGWNCVPIFTNPVTSRGTDLARKLGFRRFDPTADNNIHVVY